MYYIVLSILDLVKSNIVNNLCHYINKEKFIQFQRKLFCQKGREDKLIRILLSSLSLRFTPLVVREIPNNIGPNQWII